MIRRRTVVALIALSLVLVVRPIDIPTAAACSCAMLDDPMAEALKEPRTAVFTGLVGMPTPEGVPVAVSRWFKASPPGPVVLLDSRSFEDPMGGSCGTNRPPAGSEWIFIAWLNERARFDVNMCSTHADLASPEGQALLKDAVAAFGEAPPVPDVTEPPAEPVATVSPAGPGDPADPADPVAPPEPSVPAGVLLMAGGAGLLLLLGVAAVLVGRRGRP